MECRKVPSEGFGLDASPFFYKEGELGALMRFKSLLIAKEWRHQKPPLRKYKMVPLVRGLPSGPRTALMNESPSSSVVHSVCGYEK
jgi:hypothetical protein